MLKIKKQLNNLFNKESNGLMEDKYIGQKIKEGIWDREPEYWQHKNRDYKEACPLPDDLPDWCHNGSKKWEKTCLMTIGSFDSKTTSKHRAQS